MRKRKIGEVKEGRIPIIAKDGTTRGNVGPRATTATVARFLGHHNARLGVHSGRKSWIEQGTIPGRARCDARHVIARTRLEASKHKGDEP